MVAGYNIVSVSVGIMVCFRGQFVTIRVVGPTLELLEVGDRKPTIKQSLSIRCTVYDPLAIL